jgi:peptide/nickel transport system permease protein
MLTFMIRRSLLALLTIWALSVISFVVIQLPPGDFVDQYILDLVQGGAEGAETTPAMLDLAETLSNSVRPEQAPVRPVW